MQKIEMKQPQNRESGDALYDFDSEGLPIARDPASDAYPPSEGGEPDPLEPRVKKRQGTEDAQRRSDTGTGL